MYVYQFPSLRLLEYGDPAQFGRQTERWLGQREAENHIMLSVLTRLGAQFRMTAANAARYFALQDGNTVVAAAVATGRILYITWASLEMIPQLADGLLNAQCQLEVIHG